MGAPIVYVHPVSPEVITSPGVGKTGDAIGGVASVAGAASCGSGATASG
jgi:hypothetical protein